MDDTEVSPLAAAEPPVVGSDARLAEDGDTPFVSDDLAESEGTASHEEEESPPNESTEVSLAQELAELVRERSRARAALTRAEDLLLDGRALDEEEWATLIDQIAADDQCQDIKVLRVSSGVAYLYSALHISDSYARILLRLEENNPYELIAATVREESETYPRPTAVQVFTYHPFNLDTDRLMQLVGEMARLEQYSDVKLARASNGASYLYSARFLDDEWARSMAEWYEVGIHNSP